MENEKKLEKFLGLVTDEQSDGLAKLKWRIDNRPWLRRSQTIAISVLSTLRNNRAEGKQPGTQKELAEIMEVSPQQINKIAKGQENLTLETISRLEKALGILLIEVLASWRRDETEPVAESEDVPQIVSV